MELKANGISRSFIRNGEGTNLFYAVNKTDFELAEGRLTAISGRSGSGKTTFTNMLAGLLRPTEGSVLIDGSDIYQMSDDELSRFRNRNIGVVPQGQTGLQSLTVLENVLVPALMYGESASRREDALALLEAMEISDLADVYANELSGGELRRMAIARALINDPSIIFADEPTGDLDDETTLMVLNLLKSLADRGRSVLVITHEKEVLNYADIAYRMDKGVLRQVQPL